MDAIMWHIIFGRISYIKFRYKNKRETTELVFLCGSKNCGRKSTYILYVLSSRRVAVLLFESG